ncbi:peptide deformylase [Vibrio sp. S9_S30]|uniref:peptide deformylase n=1 Tax=Vibrio sp. S9_S30 TaxID=2720226 RepID=UPI001680B490|nr:peptide deformylase [Vibrio sp. S9_S30]MBD1559173.1 peptide deformylase [Vibrio sp. S9_S30]
MSVLQVLTFPDDRLRTVAKPVATVTPEIQKIVDDMLETMYDEEGIGLAATQVDIHQRIVVIDVSDTRDQPMVLINPEITDKRGEDGIEEGCLSIPGARALVPRAAEISVTALNREGEEYTFEADELLAICVQHELDHLEGKLFVDYLSPLKRKRIQDRMLKLKRFNEKQAKNA